MKLIKGLPAAAGLAIGPVFQIKAQPVRVDESPALDPAGEWGAYLRRWKSAHAVGRHAARSVRKWGRTRQVSDAQSLMLADPDPWHQSGRGLRTSARMRRRADGVAGDYVRALESLGMPIPANGRRMWPTSQRVTSILRRAHGPGRGRRSVGDLG
jgi:hypothetical protein